MSRKMPIAAKVGGDGNAWTLPLAILWLIGFSVWFHRFGLPNNPRFERSTLWMDSPFDLMDFVDPPFQPGLDHWSWFYLLQRVPFMLTALAIWVGAWRLGTLALSWLRIPLFCAERLFFSLCIGLSFTSLSILMLGVCGFLSRWPLIAVLGAPFIVQAISFLRARRTESEQVSHGVFAPDASPSNDAHGISRLGWIVLIVLAPFILGQLLGAISPQTDFDVVEYHLGGPKEWYQQGHITRLPHNVYTSFPFLSEMLILSGMVLYGDWQWGALAGQAVIAGFAPLTALGLFAAGRRWFSDATGWLSALVYLTSPWTYRISIIAYAEGSISCYLFATLFAALILREELYCRESKSRHTTAWTLLTGFLAGSAMACKYPGFTSVVIPIGLLLAWTVSSCSKDRRFRELIVLVLLYSAGTAASIGPWILKNTIETGNPVYPLAVRVFGGKDRTEELDAKWRKAHAAKSFDTWSDRLKDLPAKLIDVAAKNDWHSPLMFGLAPLTIFWFLRRRNSVQRTNPEQFQQRSILGIIWAYVAWQFFVWWFFTHHIDRFYVPMFSVVALLAGVGACWCESLLKGLSDRTRISWIGILCCVIAASLVYNADVMLKKEISGFNAGRLDLLTARDIATSPRIRWLNDEYESGRLSKDPKVLCVGEVLLFHARYPYVYNTVFNQSIFEQLCADPISQGQRLRPASEIRDAFRRLGITHIDVNWAIILMYRGPGNYGYTDFVNPERFAELQQMGILGPAIFSVPAALDSDQKKYLADWAPSLLTRVGKEDAFIAGQIFPVIDSDHKPQ